MVNHHQGFLFKLMFVIDICLGIELPEHDIAPRCTLPGATTAGARSFATPPRKAPSIQIFRVALGAAKC